VDSLLATVAVAALAAFPLLTATGARRRHNRWSVCALSALAFPVTWVVWFVRDNRRAGRRAFQGH
jgi:hypothetical protein